VVRHNRSDTSQSGPDLNKAVVDPEIDHVVTNFSITHVDHLVNAKERHRPALAHVRFPRPGASEAGQTPLKPKRRSALSLLHPGQTEGPGA